MVVATLGQIAAGAGAIANTVGAFRSVVGDKSHPKGYSPTGTAFAPAQFAHAPAQGHREGAQEAVETRANPLVRLPDGSETPLSSFPPEIRGQLMLMMAQEELVRSRGEDHRVNPPSRTEDWTVSDYVRSLERFLELERR